MVAVEGLEPTRSKAPADFESAASASSATPGLLAKLTRQASSLKHLGREACGEKSCSGIQRKRIAQTVRLIYNMAAESRSCADCSSMAPREWQKFSVYKERLRLLPPGYGCSI